MEENFDMRTSQNHKKGKIPQVEIEVSPNFTFAFFFFFSMEMQRLSP